MMQTLAILGLGTPEMIVIGILILLFFGAAKLPELARGLGKSLGEFKKAKKELEDEISKTQKELEEADKPEKKDDNPKPPTE